MTPALLAAVLVAAVCGAALAGLYLAWPRRLTAEDWVLHRRVMSAPPQRPITAQARLLAYLERQEGLWSLVRADLALARLSGEPGNERRFLGRLALLTLLGGLGGLLPLGLAAVAAGGPGASPLALLLPPALALLLPAWSWLRLRRRAARVRRGVERRLPRLLVAARVLLESGAATPEGALTHTAAIYQEPAAELIREALRIQEVRRLPLEAALDEVAERYGLVALERLADSLRVGARYGTRMAELLGEQSLQLRQAWFAAYRERATRAPVLLTIPALLFFVAPLLVLVLFLVFSPLMSGLGRL